MLRTLHRNVNRTRCDRKSIFFFSFKCRSFRGAYDKPRYRDIVDIVSLIIARAHFILSIIRRQSDRFVLTINCRLIELRVSNQNVGLTISYSHS